MNNKELHELIKLIDQTNLAEFRLEREDFSVTIRSKDFFRGKGQQVVSVMPNVAAPLPQAANASQDFNESNAEASQQASETKEDNSKYVEFKSPMVGTFYRKPSPDKEVFVKVGDTIQKGDVVCIIEAMKLFNEIESEISGTIVKVLIDDQTSVEFDQALFLIDPA